MEPDDGAVAASSFACMSRIRFEGVSKAYGDTTALNGFDLEIDEGEFMALLGPSGCGKTTALRLVAGFLRPTAGRILIDERDVSGLPPHRRNIGMVFQDYALFPHMTVADNIAFGLHERGQKGAGVNRRVSAVLELVKLAGMERRYSGELSGGQQQRVALARALAFEPSVLLMDEPFGALDLKLREAMQNELVHIQRQLRITTIFVTHDQGEAMAMSHRIAVMSGGRIEQLGTPDEIYNRPSTPFVADFVGKINLIKARVVGLSEGSAVLEANGTTVLAVRSPWAEIGMGVDAAVRPECLILGPPGTRVAGDPAPPTNTVEGTVVARRFGGSTLLIEVATECHGRLVVETRFDDALTREGMRVALQWPRDRTILLRTLS
jgi:spermidine/putrescine transport system ATP-binding protein